jgi:hypothetical protein
VPMRCSMTNWFSFPVAPAAAGHAPDVDEMRFPRGWVAGWRHSARPKHPALYCRQVRARM